MEKAIFLDKDGTLVEYNTYGKETRAEEVLTDVLMEDKVVEGLKHLQAKGFKLIVVSNQPWISKKVVTKEQIDELFNDLVSKLERHGIKIDDFFYCPHQTSDNCDCKKPKNGMILEAARKHDIDLKNSYMIGDTDQDIGAGKISGVKTVLVLTGMGKTHADKVNPDFSIENLNDVRKII